MHTQNSSLQRKTNQNFGRVITTIVISFSLIGVLLARPPAAWAVYTLTLAGNIATLTGDGDPDTIIIDVDGSNNLRHNLVDVALNSNIDWDPTQPLDQTLLNDAAVTININAGAGDDVIILGSSSAPASQLLASFNINGEGNNDTLTFDNSADTTARNVIVSSATSVTGMGILPTFSGVETIGISTGTGTDTINIGGPANSLDGIDTVTVNPDGGADTLTINDQSDATANTYIVSNSSVRRTSPNPTVTINYNNALESILLNTGTATDTITVQSSLASTPIQINSGDGNDSLTVNTLDDVLGLLTISGGTTGIDTVAVDDTGDGSANTYTVTPATVQHNVTNVISYETSVDSLSFKGSNANGDILIITGTVGSPVNTYTITSNYVHQTGVATVTYNSSVNNLSINGSSTLDTFLLQSTAISTSLTGGGSEDKFIFSNGVNLNGGTLNGGPGDDELNYSAYTTGVNATIGGSATGTAGISQISNITGGLGDDTLTGNSSPNTFSGGPGNDTINGKTGNDILIGGLGNDTYVFNDTVWGTDSVTEAASEGLDTMTFASLTTPLTITVSSVIVTDGTSTATHPNNEVEQVISGSGNDTFNVTASALVSRSITLNGGPHSTGDTLNYDSLGLVVTSTTNTINTEGRQPLFHLQIEKVNIKPIGGEPDLLPVFLPVVGKGF